MFLGIEIGGTKLQLGVGDGAGGPLAELLRRDIDRARGAAAILESIEDSASALMSRHSISRIGIGFGGPVDSAAGIATKSHQVEGWDHFPLTAWCQKKFGVPAMIGNDCDVAALAEARFGAGRGAGSVFFVTVGTGIGGGLVLGGRLHGAGRPAAAEIGHLRPGLESSDSHATVESQASGPAIEAAARIVMNENLTARGVAEAAASGNVIAGAVLLRACETLGWAIAQVITLIAPEVVVVGGGVSLIGEELFFKPLRAAVQQYVFPPLVGSYKIVPAGLGDLVVVHGAIALAAGESAGAGHG